MDIFLTTEIPKQAQSSQSPDATVRIKIRRGRREYCICGTSILNHRVLKEDTENTENILPGGTFFFYHALLRNNYAEAK